MLKSDDEGNPEVRFFFEPKGFGVCSVAFGYDDDSEESWEKAQKAFDKADADLALQVADSVRRNLADESDG